jgi:hypothetical protein
LPETKRKKKPVFGYADPYTGAIMGGCDFVQDTKRQSPLHISQAE